MCEAVATPGQDLAAPQPTAHVTRRPTMQGRGPAGLQPYDPQPGLCHETTAERGEQEKGYKGQHLILTAPAAA